MRMLPAFTEKTLEGRSTPQEETVSLNALSVSWFG